MKKIFLIITLFGITIFPQSSGNNGLHFLKFGFGARNIAMGDAGSSLSNDVTSLFYNPSGLAGTEGSEAIFMHSEWIQDVKSEVGGIRSKLFGLPVALGFNLTSVGDIEVRQKPGEPESTFDVNYFFGSISTGFFITDEVSFGTSVKYLYEGMYTEEATGFAFDFGLTYLTPIKGLTASAVYKNLGSMNELRIESTKLPAELRVGTAYAFDISDSDFGLTAAAEFHKYTLEDEIHLNAGTEVIYKNTIALRGGYQSGYESRGLTGGIGLIWGNLNFDYAFVPFSLGFGSANLFSLGFRF
ncbi:MAG: PorV/PorQ family protein [Ignavibacteriales bacterium]|nr:MAG: PorV/PorQ family protein [Ignavibacteriales bacterium]